MISMRKLSPPCLMLSTLLGYFTSLVLTYFAASTGAEEDHSLTDLKHDLHEEVVPTMPGAEHQEFHLDSPHELWLLQQGLEIIVSLTSTKS
jgi:hypothetical protein